MKYWRAAFTRPLNLLVVTVAVVAACLSPAPLIAVPVVAALEVGYLAFAANSTVFQQRVEMAERESRRGVESQQARLSVNRLYNGLPQEYRSKFQSLRNRCRELDQLTAKLDTGNDRAVESFESRQTRGLDELLWTYLKLLASHHAVAKFLSTTNAEQIAVDIQRAESRLADAHAEPTVDATEQARHVEVLQDSLAVSRERLANVERSQRNLRSLQNEIERLENKIRALSEATINRHESATVRQQVSLLADELRATEQTIQDLRAITGLEELTTAPPLVQDKLLAR